MLTDGSRGHEFTAAAPAALPLNKEQTSSHHLFTAVMPLGLIIKISVHWQHLHGLCRAFTGQLSLWGVGLPLLVAMGLAVPKMLPWLLCPGESLGQV